MNRWGGGGERVQCNKENDEQVGGGGGEGEGVHCGKAEDDDQVEGWRERCVITNRRQDSLDDFAGFVGSVDEVGSGSGRHGQQQLLTSRYPRLLREGFVQTLKG